MLDDDPETAAIVKAYFNVMERVTFSVLMPGEEVKDGDKFAYMALQKQCHLCLKYFKQDEELMKIPMCDHLLHPHCLKRWLVDFQKCPVCKSNIVKLP